ncbi:hypothetical protein [Streptomyces sp. NPDC001604]|uniref:hypothetical protein n=1 Tax=Streptomyces sp. NPDC001604 TaxID=3364593 RepID=UPI0036A64610
MPEPPWGTGGAHGLGPEIGRQLADRALRVLVGARERAAAEEACRTVGPRALPLVLDVTCAKSVVAAVQEHGSRPAGSTCR